MYANCIDTCNQFAKHSKNKNKKSNAFHNTHTKRTSVNSQITLHEEPFLYLSVFNTNDDFLEKANIKYIKLVNLTNRVVREQKQTTLSRSVAKRAMKCEHQQKSRDPH